MTQNFQKPNSAGEVNSFSGSSISSSTEAEQTLRLLAKLPPPPELTERVHQRLSDARALRPQRRFWSLWMPTQRLQFAGAALLVLVFAGSTWSVYHAKVSSPASVPAPQNSSTPANSASPAGATSGGFSSAGAERHPTSLAPIKVPQTPKKKPSASRAARLRQPVEAQPAASSN